MRKLLALGLLTLLVGCSHTPQAPDINGIWINQALIDAAAQGRPLKVAGSNLEWDIDTRKGEAQASSGYEASTGSLRQKSPNAWTVGEADELRLDGKHLIQPPRDYARQEVFSRPAEAAIPGAKWSSTFRRALNTDYMGGKWRILSGQGAGNTVVFTTDGKVSGLSNIDHYELCLGGDCWSQGAGNDTLFLNNKDQGDTWIYVRKGKQLEIFQAVNTAQADEVPSFTPGPRQWLLEKQ